MLTWPGVTALPGAKPWLLGLANVRGQLLPVTDLAAFFGGEPTTIGRSSRVMMVNHADIPAGLLVDEVRGFRRFVASEKAEVMPETLPGMTPFLSGAYGTDEDMGRARTARARGEHRVPAGGTVRLKEALKPSRVN